MASRSAGGKRRSISAWLEERFNLTEMFSFAASFGLFPAELDTRRPFDEALQEAIRRPLPSYGRWPRVLGILSLLVFAFLAATGVLLAFYYQPTTGEAYRSVTTIVRDVNFGWFLHQAHRWSARLLLVILLVRLWRFFFQGMYKAPREALWIVALLTFLVATHADLTGRLLTWNADGYWTTVRALEVLYSLPLVGPMFSFLIGGPRIDSLVLTRFYVLHLAAIPFIMTGLFYLHFSGVRRVGLSAVAAETRPIGGALKVHLYNLLILTALLFGALVTLVTLLPVPFIDPADPFATPVGARPPWYLLAAYGLLEIFPSAWPRFLPGLAIEATLAVAFLLPFLDRSPGREMRRRRLAIAIGATVLVAWACFTWYGFRLEIGG
jgi:quinol-cytochrome oxidoreductase complex cytochrome b subunit